MSTLSDLCTEMGSIGWGNWEAANGMCTPSRRCTPTATPDRDILRSESGQPDIPRLAGQRERAALIAGQAQYTLEQEQAAAVWLAQYRAARARAGWGDE